MPDQERVPPEAADGGPGEGTDPSVEPEPALPEPVRQRVLALAAAAIGVLPADELPAALRRVAQFAPNRRARLGAAAIATQIVTDPVLRQRVGARVIEQAGELGAAVAQGAPPAVADPVEVAALAYLGRPPRWLELVAGAAATLRSDAESAAMADRLATAEQRVARSEHERAVAKVEAEKLRDELSRLRTEAAGLRDEVRALSRSLREAQAAQRRGGDLLATEKGRAARAATEADAELRRLRAKLAEAEVAAGGARAAAKEARAVDDVRLWLLLETIGQAAAGLKRELALQPPGKLPADYVADSVADRPGAQRPSGARALEADDPVRLDHLLALPRAHLVVDGYNVTKRGFGEVSLEQQRGRLVAGLGGLAAQSGVEVTVVFDGAEKLIAGPTPPRGVRVLFSRKGQTADELIRALVRAEPAGRTVVVISSDREVADGVRRHGAYPLGSDTLLRRLART